MMILCIDDSPGRFDDLARIVARDRPEVRWVIACHPDEVEALIPRADAILLDHDMPYRDGRQWAQWLVANAQKVPVVVVSTTGTPDVREEMLTTFADGGWVATGIYADHLNCELEWLAWLNGATAVSRETGFKYARQIDIVGPLSRGTEGSAGMDIRSAVETYVYGGAAPVLVPTGLYVEIPYGYMGQVVPRSGLAAKQGVSVLNAPGIIDSDYRGELKVLLFKVGNGAYKVSQGERIAQLLIVPCSMASPTEVKEVSAATTRTGGFGSTGQN